VSFDGQNLFSLLPALYRLRDAGLAQRQNLLSSTEAARGPLQSLLMLIAEQIAAVEEDLDGLYDDQFIETCAPWVIPYIGDLIGYQAVHGVAPAVGSPRAEVAHTISFRRRKGTVLVLEQLARAVTGWSAHAVEFFQVLADTQYMNHVRPRNHYAPDLRRSKPRVYMNSGFDRTVHTVDVRRIAIERGRYNIQNIGIFLWSLNYYSATMSPAAPVAGNPLCFRFSTLGRDTPLFYHPIPQGFDIATPAQPVNVPDHLRRTVLCRDIAGVHKSPPAPSVYYGVGKSLVLEVDGAIVPANAIQVCNLSGSDGSWANMPTDSTYVAAIDPALGRIALVPPTSGKAPSHVVRTLYYYGFNADIGGGEYPRADSFTAGASQPIVRVPDHFPAIAAAVNALGGNGVVEITDSDVHVESTGFAVDVAPNGHIELRAASGCRPTLVLGGEIVVSGGADATLDINGFVVASNVKSADPTATLLRARSVRPNGEASKLGYLRLTHCTLVPGWALQPNGDPQSPGQPVLVVEPAGLQLVIAKSIVGALRAPEFANVTISESIVDANGRSQVAFAAVDATTLDRTGAGAALTLTGSTVVGKVHSTLLTLVSNSIFWSELAAGDTWKGPLWAERKQEGCVRFSYLPQGAITPRKFECVAAGRGMPGPLFASLRYGDPAYAKLLPPTDDAIRRGADDGGEMGAFHFLLAPQRETDLRVRMQEYLPVGMEFGVFYET
jgi:hypothetical protein